MIDSIFTAMTGLEGHQRGLKVISNNVANMNTTGFKASVMDFADVFTGQDPSRTPSETGSGLNADRSRLDLRAGGLQDTERDTDLAIDGRGFFVLKDAAGDLRYTRAGNFEFNTDGELISGTSGLQVMARDGSGNLSAIQFKNTKTNPPKATSRVVLGGNLSSTDDEHSIDALAVYDSQGGAHTLKLTFKRDTTSVAENRWTVTIAEGASDLGQGELKFSPAGTPESTASSIKATLTLQGGATTDIEFALDADATSYSSGSTSTLALKEQDGYAPGQVSTVTFDEKGQLKITYTNGQKEDGAALAFAEFTSEEDLAPAGDGLLESVAGASITYRTAGDGLKVVSKKLELSNVNLTQEFSSLILMQRGYQASSQVLTTANEMLQQLLDLKGRR